MGWDAASTAPSPASPMSPLFHILLERIAVRPLRVLSSCERKASLQDRDQEGVGRKGLVAKWLEGCRKQMRGVVETSGGFHGRGSQAEHRVREVDGQCAACLSVSVCETLTIRRYGRGRGARVPSPQALVLNTGTRLLRLESQLGL